MVFLSSTYPPIHHRVHYSGVRSCGKARTGATTAESEAWQVKAAHPSYPSEAGHQDRRRRVRSTGAVLQGGSCVSARSGLIGEDGERPSPLTSSSASDSTRAMWAPLLLVGPLRPLMGRSMLAGQIVLDGLSAHLGPAGKRVPRDESSRWTFAGGEPLQPAHPGRPLPWPARPVYAMQGHLGQDPCPGTCATR